MALHVRNKKASSHKHELFFFTAKPRHGLLTCFWLCVPWPVFK